MCVVCVCCKDLLPATGKIDVSGICHQPPKSDGVGDVGAPGLCYEDLEQVRVSVSASGTGPWLIVYGHAPGGKKCLCLKAETQV